LLFILRTCTWLIPINNHVYPARLFNYFESELSSLFADVSVEELAGLFVEEVTCFLATSSSESGK